MVIEMNPVKYIKSHGIKRTFEVIYRYKIDAGMRKIIQKLTGDKLLNNVIVIESHNDFDSTGGAFYNYLIKKGLNQKYKIVWLIKNKKVKNLPQNIKQFYLYKPNLLKDYYVVNAKYVLTCQDAIGSEKKDQISIYLTHGAFGLKDCKGKIDLPHNLSYCLMPSEYVEPLLRDQYNLSSNTKSLEIGFPTHDIFYDKTSGDLSKVTDKQYEKVILWMPTFRKGKAFKRNDSSINLPLGIPIIQDMAMFNDLNSILKKEKALLIIKLHPMQDLSEIKLHNLSNIKILDGISVKEKGIDNYRLMKDADALISDYSSAAYDFLHLDRPIGFTIDDLNEYKLGLISDSPDEFICGPKIRNYDEFLKFVSSVLNDKDSYRNKRHEVFDKVFKFHDGNSSKRLSEFMNLNY